MADMELNSCHSRSLPFLIPRVPSKLLPLEKQFTTRRPSSPTRRRSIRLSPIVEYSRLQPPVGVWAVLSPIGGGQALTSPRRHSLGSLLHCQLADTAQAFPLALKLYSLKLSLRPSCISPAFAGLFTTRGEVPMYYYLVRH